MYAFADFYSVRGRDGGTPEVGTLGRKQHKHGPRSEKLRFRPGTQRRRFPLQNLYFKL
jgi:hypothetical protein